MIVPSYHYMTGPTVALLALGVIILICRWVFSTSHRDDRTARRLAQARSRGDYGLLVPVATTAGADEAGVLRERLREAGLRCTVADGVQPGTFSVLVFRADADRAALWCTRNRYTNGRSATLSRRTSAPSSTSCSTNRG